MPRLCAIEFQEIRKVMCGKGLGKTWKKGGKGIRIGNLELGGLG
jgi:hypothetical protein